MSRDSPLRQVLEGLGEREEVLKRGKWWGGEGNVGMEALKLGEVVCSHFSVEVVCVCARACVSVGGREGWWVGACGSGVEPACIYSHLCFLHLNEECAHIPRSLLAYNHTLSLTHTHRYVHTYIRIYI